MNFIKKNYLWLILILSLGLWVFVISKKPCDSPITYKISSLDSRFGISEKDLNDDILSAIAIWEGPTGKKLFKYDPNGSLSINLIYDSRQKNTQQAQNLESKISKTDTVAESVKAQYSNLKIELALDQAKYQTMLDAFKADTDAYNSQVSLWNSRGGAPKDEYNKLNDQKNNLLTEQTNLENTRVQINNLTNQINQFVDKYNLLVKDENSSIDQINQNAGMEFDEGVYSPSKNEIDIYQFTNNQKLIRVLAHELGHALGLGHNSNNQSIMYDVNQSNTMHLSSQDLGDFKTVCKIK